VNFRVNLNRRLGGVLDDIAFAAKAPKTLLRRWAGFLKTKAQERASDSGSLAPWAESTRKKYENTRTAAVTAQGDVRASYARQLDRRLRRTPDARAELRRLLAGGNTGTQYSVLEGDDRRKKRLAVDRLRRQLYKARTTGQRVGGDAKKSERHELLGAARRAWSVFINRSSTKLRSKLPFSEVLFHGGRVGHGAVLPERNVLYVDGADVAELGKIALDWLMGRKK
jgi:hypothetical protein